MIIALFALALLPACASAQAIPVNPGGTAAITGDTNIPDACDPDEPTLCDHVELRFEFTTIASLMVASPGHEDDDKVIVVVHGPEVLDRPTGCTALPLGNLFDPTATHSFECATGPAATLRFSTHGFFDTTHGVDIHARCCSGQNALLMATAEPQACPPATAPLALGAAAPNPNCGRPCPTPFAVHPELEGPPFTPLSLDDQRIRIVAKWTPPDGRNLSEVASACHFIGFDWTQTVDAIPPEIDAFTDANNKVLKAPFPDPPPAGYAYQTDLAHLDQAFPFYYDRLDHSIPAGVYNLGEHILNDQDLLYGDSPKQTCTRLNPFATSCFQPGHYVEFTTHLAGILPDGQPSEPLFTWHWKSNYSCVVRKDFCAGFGGAVLNADLPGVPGGTGGITIVDVNGVPQSDTRPPDTLATASPTANANGWNNSNVNVTLTAGDDLSGVDRTEFDLDNAGFRTYNRPVAITSDGIHTLRYRSVDNAGNLESTQTATVRIDKTVPVVSCSASPGTLWPPNHKLAAVRTTVHVTDQLSGPAGFSLYSATSSEPDVGHGDNTRNDVQGWTIGTPDTAGLLRAERVGGGPGRTYTLTYLGKDRADNRAYCKAVVNVPHRGRDAHGSPGHQK